jgi:transposase InsO family protein
LIDITIERPNQVWVADITYIGKRANPIYLSLITDAYSKKIVGYYVADNLSTESSIWALKMALKERKDKSESLVHHSDREYNIVLMLIKKYYRKIKSYVA